MTHYIFQVMVFQLLFFTVYVLLLKNETFFTYNRIYLLGTAVLSFLLPFMQFESINQQIPEVFRIQLPAVLIGEASAEMNTTVHSLDPVTLTISAINWADTMIFVYAFGVLAALAFFVLKLRKLSVLRSKGTCSKILGYRLCLLPESKVAFTFLQTIYLGEAISEAEKTQIIAHEKIHIDQKHTLDLLFFEVLKILFWFNPMVYIYQKQLKILHEFTADKAVSKENKSDYYQKLLAQVFGTTNISFINTFFNQSLIKKRIIMLQKSESNRVFKLKYLVIFPLFVGMLVYTSCNDADNSTPSQSSSEDTEVMQKITELSEAIMKKGELTDEESNALKLLTTEGQAGDKIYLSVDEYITDSSEEAVAMSKLEKVPVFPGCHTLDDNDELRECFAGAIRAHVAKYFDVDMAKKLGLTGDQKISVQFKINKIGIVQDVVAKASDPALEREAKRVINQLPKMRAGIQDGKPVNVIYSLPILFKIED